MDDEPSLPVHVEALVPEIPLWSAVAFPLRGGDLAVVRKGEGLHEHILMRHSYPLLGAGDRRRMPEMEGVEWLQGPVVKQDADPRLSGFAPEESVKDQLEVGTSLVKLAHEVIHVQTGWLIARLSVELLPYNQCA